MGVGLQEPPGQGAPQLGTSAELDQTLKGKCAQPLTGQEVTGEHRGWSGRRLGDLGSDKRPERTQTALPRAPPCSCTAEGGLLSLSSTPPALPSAPPLPRPLSAGPPSLSGQVL